LPAQAPVTLAATLACPAFTEIAIGATSVPDVALVAFPIFRLGNYPLQFATVTAGGVSIQEVGASTLIHPFILVDGNDAPAIVASGGKASTGEVFGVAVFRPAQPVWSEEVVIPPATLGGYIATQTYGALLGSTGQPRVLFYYGTVPGSLLLAERSASGTWPTVQINGDGYYPAAMAVDSLGRTRIVYKENASDAITEWVDGSTTAASYPTDPSQVHDLAVAPGPSGTLGVARVNPTGIAVTSSSGTKVSSDQIIPGTPPYGFGFGCTFPSGVCQATTCKVDGVMKHALASTSDGAFWVGYYVRHLDRDYSATMDQSGNCQRTIVTDRSKDEVALVHLAANGSAAPSKRWSFSLPVSDFEGLDLAARGARLYLAFSEKVIHVFVLDWTKLL